VAANQQRKAQAQIDREQYQAAQQQAQIDAAAQAAVAAHHGSAPASAPAPAEAAGGDLVGELQKLAALKEQGVLTDEEFAAAKAQLLG